MLNPEFFAPILLTLAVVFILFPWVGAMINKSLLSYVDNLLKGFSWACIFFGFVAIIWLAVIAINYLIY